MLEKEICYKFKDKKILQEALTHPSVKRFSKEKTSYERLEFLGDKALGLAIAQLLIEKFPLEEEGRLSKRHAFLVCKDFLVLVAKRINLGEFLIISKNQIADGGKESESILENGLEALIGGIFVDGGFENVLKFVSRYFLEKIESEDYKNPPQDSKSAFQEWFQKKYKKLPEYLIFQKEDGSFTANLQAESQIFTGTGKTIKEAEKKAALEALKLVQLKSRKD